jgi:hypothetical protein
MLLAPLCAQFCATQACARHASGVEREATECHHTQFGDTPDGSRLSLASAKTCNPTELPAATLSASDGSSVERAARASAFTSPPLASVVHVLWSPFTLAHCRHNKESAAVPRSTVTPVLQL